MIALLFLLSLLRIMDFLGTVLLPPGGAASLNPDKLVPFSIARIGFMVEIVKDHRDVQLRPDAIYIPDIEYPVIILYDQASFNALVFLSIPGFER